MKWYSLLLLLPLLPPAHAGTILNLNWTDGDSAAGLPTSLVIDLANYQDGGPSGMGEFFEDDSDVQASQLLIGSDSIWASGLTAPYAILYHFEFEGPNANLLELARGPWSTFSGSELAANYLTGSSGGADLSGELTVGRNGLQPLDLTGADDGTPEPATAIMMGSALLLLGVAGRKMWGRSSYFPARNSQRPLPCGRGSERGCCNRGTSLPSPDRKGGVFGVDTEFCAESS